VEQLLGLPELVNVRLTVTDEAISNAVIAVVIIVKEWGLKIRLRPCALTPLLPTLADEGKLAVL